MLCGLWGCSLGSLVNHNFNMSENMNKNGCSYVVLRLVSIEVILRLRRCLVLAANFFYKKTSQKPRFKIFVDLQKKWELLKLVNMFFENSSLKVISGQSMSDPLKRSSTDDSRFLQAAILNKLIQIVIKTMERNGTPNF